ncbi:MAG: dephospho-CoA kinase [Tissierellia bacterium]|nr:dephospho-CoA kinase [Tissierellia bacterium]
MLEKTGMKQSSKYLIALTGVISSGKSICAKFIEENSYKVIYYDEINRELLKQKQIIEEIVQKLGDEIIEGSKINKKLLAKTIFSDKTKRNILTDIMHPKIIKEAYKIIKETDTDRPIFLEIPLLFQTLRLHESLNIRFNEIWAISSNKENRIERLMKRDNISKNEAILRIESNFSDDYIKRNSDIYIINDKTIEELKKSIIYELNRLEKRYSYFVQRHKEAD